MTYSDFMTTNEIRNNFSAVVDLLYGNQCTNIATSVINDSMAQCINNVDNSCIFWSDNKPFALYPTKQVTIKPELNPIDAYLEPIYRAIDEKYERNIKEIDKFILRM